MNMIRREFKNKNGSVDKIMATSSDNYQINIGNNYKLVKFYKERKSFSDTLLGSDIGFNSNGFASVMFIATLIACAVFSILVLSFRI